MHETSGRREGYFGPQSVAWRVHSDPAGWIGGGRALLIQALHPVAMAVFTQNTRYQDDPWGRLFRTSDFFIKVIFGDKQMADAAAAKVRGIHRRATGIDPRTSVVRRADEPDLLLWIHATAVDSFIAAHRQFAGGLSQQDADAYAGEMAVIAELLGVPRHLIPRSESDIAEYLREIRPSLQMTEEAREAVRWMLFFPPIPVALRPMWLPVTTALISSLPGYAREMYGLPWTKLADPAVRAALFGLTRALKLLAKPPPIVADAIRQMRTDQKGLQSSIAVAR